MKKPETSYRYLEPKLGPTLDEIPIHEHSIPTTQVLAQSTGLYEAKET